MEAHLKAKELIEKFGHYTKFYNDRTESIDVNLDDAKQCALICVDEIMRTLQPDNNYVMRFWKETRNEITKL